FEAKNVGLVVLNRGSRSLRFVIKQSLKQLVRNPTGLLTKKCGKRAKIIHHCEILDRLSKKPGRFTSCFELN
ncbi:MAG: hypothetical protein LBF32_01610, partial [Streptococcaceae bacterium]|nr:hypothetical protein [Streptococcaceae bacterium]